VSELKKYTVFPGQYMITSVPALVTTVLGSCVSVCLWDKVAGIGGMNHYLLPGTEDDEPGNMDRGIKSIQLLVRSMLNRRATIENMEAKVFGGCNSLYKENNFFKIGERNAAIAFEILKGFNIHVSAQHVGGSYGRKIIFNTSTGKVRTKLLTETAAEINEKINKGFGY
jgi:chemotaxis protein CheD